MHRKQARKGRMKNVHAELSTVLHRIMCDAACQNHGTHDRPWQVHQMCIHRKLIGVHGHCTNARITIFQIIWGRLCVGCKVCKAHSGYDEWHAAWCRAPGSAA